MLRIGTCGGFASVGFASTMTIEDGRKRFVFLKCGQASHRARRVGHYRLEDMDIQLKYPTNGRCAERPAVVLQLETRTFSAFDNAEHQVVERAGTERHPGFNLKRAHTLNLHEGLLVKKVHVVGNSVLRNFKEAVFVDVLVGKILVGDRVQGPCADLFENTEETCS